jgi:hypothetical protein
MMDENEIRRRFAQLRESDRVGAPSFAQTYARARSRRASAAPHVSSLLIAAAAAILIVAVWQANSRSLSPSTTTAIATWRAPTDVLLRTPGSELLSTMPALNKSILDKMIPTPE